MRNQPSALSQVCINTAEKKQQLEDTGRGEKHENMEKRRVEKAKRRDLISTVRIIIYIII